MQFVTRFLTFITVAGALGIGSAGRSSNAIAAPQATDIGRSADASTGAAVPGRDPRLYGVWIAKTYMYNGRAHPMDSGLMVITPTYLIADAIYDLSAKRKPTPDGNANYGTYRVVAPGVLVMDQAMQLHWRSEGGDSELVSGDHTMFNRNVPERIKYEVNGDTLTFYFQVAGEQSWIMKRAVAETCTSPGP